MDVGLRVQSVYHIDLVLTIRGVYGKRIQKKKTGQADTK